MADAAARSGQEQRAARLVVVRRGHAETLTYSPSW
jgi:hypothetical protein